MPGKSHGQRSFLGYNPWCCRRVRHDLVTKYQQQSLIDYICSCNNKAASFLPSKVPLPKSRKLEANTLTLLISDLNPFSFCLREGGTSHPGGIGGIKLSHSPQFSLNSYFLLLSDSRWGICYVSHRLD